MEQINLLARIKLTQLLSLREYHGRENRQILRVRGVGSLLYDFVS